MNDKKKLRRLEHLLRLNLFPIEKIRFPELCKPELWRSLKDKEAFIEISSLISDLEMTIEETIDLGQTLRHEKWSARSIYQNKPIQSRRDNKDVKVGSGGSNRNKVRFPKKCRKTAWKRFYKLFPHLNPQHLHRYCAEFETRYNGRNEGNVAQFFEVVKNSDKRRIRYKELTSTCQP